MALRFSTTLFTLMLITLQSNSQSHFLKTHYELGNYNVTPNYVQTLNFCKKLDSISPFITFQFIGKSETGLGIPLLIADKNGLINPESIRKQDRLIIHILACNHPGEPDGKDAGFLLFRDLAFNTNGILELLDNVSIVFIPIFNVDGHEMFSKHTRINQNGPIESGWRTNALNLNLNRDFMKASSKEMKHYLNFFHHWKPDFSFDCHTTNGADYQYVLTYAMETGQHMLPAIPNWSENNYLSTISKAMEKDGLPIFPYISFRSWHDPREAIMHYPSPPFISNGYFAANNRPGLLIETHMLKPYNKRVEATYKIIYHTLLYLNTNHKELQGIINQANGDMTSGEYRKDAVVLETTLSGDSTIIDFLGVHFQVDTSQLSGGLWFRYQADKPEIWQRAFFYQTTPSLKANLPQAYILPPQYSRLVKTMSLHNIQYSTTTQEHHIEIKQTLFKNVDFPSKPFEGCTRPTYDTHHRTISLTYPAGSYIIPLNQESGRVAALLLEPESKSSFAAWGFFNTIFEQKEYVEMYVMEKIARKMIEENPQLLVRFDKEKSQSPDKYNTQRSILYWFYEQSPWFDQRLNVYPVGSIYGNFNNYN